MARDLKFVGLGEALIDLFEDGSASLGGAPLNVAVHAHHLLAPLKLGSGIVVSALGADKFGAQARAVLAENGMTTDYVATNECPTGTASVFVRNGEPGFEIAQDVAWDYLRASAATDALADRCDAVCFGSLGQRSEASREMIRAFVQRARRAWRLCDMNLRRSTLSGRRDYSREIVEASCRLSSAMKANEQEMVELGEVFGLGAVGEGEGSMWTRMEFFLKEFGLEAVVVTRAERGALALAQGENIAMPPAQMTTQEIHAVGAGDAFSAGILFGRSQGWPWRATLELATKMGTWVTRHVSAIPQLSPEILEYVADQMRQYAQT
ncbi:MAG TPA: PfkB family carbohydrate kinase [Candidatus Acidoferrales bacterium]|nr:PfkB family carbohydrate kinase [Candidatus Acidoferrales bacterium]